MAVANRYRVLYFIWGPVPTLAQLEDARQYGLHVAFRNACHIAEGEACEPCSAYAGEHVPAQYKRKFPEAVSYDDWLNGKLPVMQQALPFAAPASDTPLFTMERKLFSDRVVTPVEPPAPPVPPPASADEVDQVPPPPPPGTEPISELVDARGTWQLPPPPPMSEVPPLPAGAAPPAPRLSKRQAQAKEAGEGAWQPNG